MTTEVFSLTDIPLIWSFHLYETSPIEQRKGEEGSEAKTKHITNRKDEKEFLPSVQGSGTLLFPGMERNIWGACMEGNRRLWIHICEAVQGANREHGIERRGDTDTARCVSCCVSLLFISTEPSRHALAFLLFFFVNHMCGTGPLGQNKLPAHVAFNDNLEHANHREAV